VGSNPTPRTMNFRLDLGLFIQKLVNLGNCKLESITRDFVWKISAR
jgi:hypothetical protein